MRINGIQYAHVNIQATNIRVSSLSVKKSKLQVVKNLKDLKFKIQFSTQKKYASQKLMVTFKLGMNDDNLFVNFKKISMGKGILNFYIRV